jgi:hypothetical protein
MHLQKEVTHQTANPDCFGRERQADDRRFHKRRRAGRPPDSPGF